MKVELLENARYKGKPQNKGDVINIPGGLAKRWFSARIAKPYNAEKGPEQYETATEPPAENAMLSFNDLNKGKGGHYYLNGEHFAHGENNAREKLKELK